MATTSQTTSKDGQEFSKGNAPELGQNVGAKELGQDGANPVSISESVENELSTSPTPAAVQAAKDFIWEHLPKHTKEMMILEATTDAFSSKGLECAEIRLTSKYK